MNPPSRLRSMHVHTHMHTHVLAQTHTPRKEGVLKWEHVGVLYNSGFVFLGFELIRYHVEFQV